MKIGIVTHGIPNLFSEGTTKEAIILIEELKKRNISTKLFIQNYTKIFASSSSKDKLFKSIKNYEYKIIQEKNTSLLQKIIKNCSRLFSRNPDNFFTDHITRKKIESLIYKYNPDLIINMLNIPCSSNYGLKYIPTYNYINMPPHEVEKLRFEIYKKDFRIQNFFLMLNSLIYYKNIHKTYKKVFKNTRIGFLASPDSFNYYKKILKGKKLITLKNFTKNQNQKYFPYTKKKKVIIMVGNLKATFTKEGLYDLSENIMPYLLKLRKKINFKLYIIGKFDPPTSVKYLLKYDWIKFTGWVQDINKYYKIANCILVSNPTPLGTRIRILNCMQAGVPIVTYKSNVLNNKEFIYNKNILFANDPKSIVNELEKVLLNNKLGKRLSLAGYKTIKKHYNYKKIANFMIDTILKDYKSINN